MELVQVSYLHSGLFSKHRTTTGRGGFNLVNDPMIAIECQFIHV